MKKIGYFGGSFDPIHNGHLHLSLEIAEKHKLDEVYFCPTSQSPFKKEKPPVASKDHRRAMVTAAISPLPQFTLLDFEIQKHETCYTIDTIEAFLKTLGGKANLFLILGEDSLADFHLWKRVDELVDLAKPLIGSRFKTTIEKPKGIKEKLYQKIEKGLTPIPVLEISSTQIRDRLKKGLYCGHLLPPKVGDYIEQHHLYKK